MSRQCVSRNAGEVAAHHTRLPFARELVIATGVFEGTINWPWRNKNAATSSRTGQVGKQHSLQSHVVTPASVAVLPARLFRNAPPC